MKTPSSSRQPPSAKAAIERIHASQGERVDALTKWLDALVTNFSDRIHPLDGEVYTRASEIMRHWQRVPVRVRYLRIARAVVAIGESDHPRFSSALPIK